MNKHLTYKFDKSINLAKIYYPVRFATGHDIESFPIDEIKCIMMKEAIQSTEIGATKIGKASGFDFVLHSGKKIHCGIYSSSYKEIDDISNIISRFLNIEIVEGNDIDVLFN